MVGCKAVSYVRVSVVISVVWSGDGEGMTVVISGVVV